MASFVLLNSSMGVLTIIGVINTIVCTFACPVIAAYKGRSVFGWIIGGLLLGLIGLLIVACLPRKD